MMKYRGGQMFVNLMLFIMALFIFILASPMLATIIGESVGGMGSATAFFVKLFLWIIFLVLIAFFIKIVSSGEGFFVS